VTKGEMIGRLEVLLERVRTRGAEPHGKRADATEVIAGVAVGRDIVATESATEEVRPSDGHDSRERLVAAEFAAPEPAPVERAAPVHESTPPLDMADMEVVAEEEEPPASSRRTVASQPEERLAQMAFGVEEPRPPLHTPPPESGRLPAAPVAEFDADVTGVRNATPLLPRRNDQPVRRELVPEATRPQLAPSDVVAEVIAEAQRFAPSTFVALLDASLAL
jgi:hypothetical protein